MAKFLCIGIPARNEAGSIERTIRSIVKSKAWRENTETNRELIVCVNGSRDGTAAIVRTLAKSTPEIKLIELKKPGKNRAINEIARISSRRADTIYYSDDKIKVIYDAIVVSRPPTLYDHMKQRVRHKRQKRILLQARPDLRAAAEAQGKEVSPRKLTLLREVSPKALFGVVLNQFAEAWAMVKAKGKHKEPWLGIKSTKLKSRRRK